MASWLGGLCAQSLDVARRKVGFTLKTPETSGRKARSPLAFAGDSCWTGRVCQHNKMAVCPTRSGARNRVHHLRHCPEEQPEERAADWEKEDR